MRLRGLCRLLGGWDWFLPSGGWSWLLSLWWAGPCQGVCLSGSCVLRKTLSSLSADGWGCVPALLVVWPEESQHWSLQAVGWGQVLVRKWWPPGGLTPMSTPQNYCRQCFCPCSKPQVPASTGDPPILAGKTTQSLMRLLLFSLVHMRRCVHPPRVEFVSPSPVEFLWSNQWWPSKPDSLGAPPPIARPPGWGAWHGAQNLHSCRWTCVVNLFSSLWVTHLACMGFDFIMVLLPSRCGFFFVFGCRVSFLVSSSVLLSIVVQQLVVTSVFP